MREFTSMGSAYNGLEFLEPAKRGLKGTYVTWSRFTWFRYLDEQVFRYNHRHGLNDGERFHRVMGLIAGTNALTIGTIDCKGNRLNTPHERQGPRASVKRPNPCPFPEHF